MERKNKLKKLTLELLACTDTLEKKLENVKKTGKSADFYQEVKPFADNSKRINDEWRKMSLDWVKLERPTNVYVQQIESTHEHMDAIAVQAFFPETSQTRFKNMVASVKYILNNVLNNLMDEEREPL